jgi:peptide deformylase
MSTVQHQTQHVMGFFFLHIWNKWKEHMTSHTTFLSASNNNTRTTLGSLFSMTLCIVNGFSAFSLNLKLEIITICKASLNNECSQYWFNTKIMTIKEDTL